MEAGTGCGGGTDGRTGIHAHSISVTCPVLGEQQRGARRRASGHGRGGRQARSRDATRDAAACGSSGGGAGAHDRAVRSTSQRCDAERQQHGIGRGPGQRRVKRRGATARYDTWHGFVVKAQPQTSSSHHDDESIVFYDSSAKPKRRPGRSARKRMKLHPP